MLCLVFRESADEWFARAQNFITENLGWFLILAVNFIVIFCLCVAFYQSVPRNLNDPCSTSSTSAPPFTGLNLSFTIAVARGDTLLSE